MSLCDVDGGGVSSKQGGGGMVGSPVDMFDSPCEGHLLWNVCCILFVGNPRCFGFLVDPWWCIIIVGKWHGSSIS